MQILPCSFKLYSRIHRTRSGTGSLTRLYLLTYINWTLDTDRKWLDNARQCVLSRRNGRAILCIYSTAKRNYVQERIIVQTKGATDFVRSIVRRKTAFHLAGRSERTVFPYQFLQVLLPLTKSGVTLLSRLCGLERVDYLKPRLLVRQQTPLEHQAESFLRGVAASHSQQDAIVARLFQQRRDKSLSPATARQQSRELLERKERDSLVESVS